ncbi:MAG: alpha/beta hydrolase [Bacteroidetes bacterium]|nr:alpha/beta hydrolase [Bacteroidota bacterium]
MKKVITNINVMLSILAIISLPVIAQAQVGHFANVNGIRMYYEIHGSGSPLVLLHGGGSTIHTSFGRILPDLAKTHQVIAIELQAHGHTADRNAPVTFEQDAADVAELLQQLHIRRADIFGFSNGGQTALEIGIKHPGIVNKLVVASAFYKRDAVPAWFWKGFDDPKFSDMPQVYKDEYLKIKDQAALMNMFQKDAQRMKNFKDWTDEEIRSIQAPTLVVIGDQDLPLPEHAAAMARLLPHGRLAILPGRHGEYFGEVLFAQKNSKEPEAFVEILNEFLASH